MAAEQFAVVPPVDAQILQEVARGMRGVSVDILAAGDSSIEQRKSAIVAVAGGQALGKALERPSEKPDVTFVNPDLQAERHDRIASQLAAGEVPVRVAFGGLRHTTRDARRLSFMGRANELAAAQRSA